MNQLRLVGLAFLVACSGSGSLPPDGGVDSGGPKDSGKDSTVTDGGSDAQSSDGSTDDASGDASDGGTIDASDGGSAGDGSAQCTVPSTPPSGGSCITLNVEAGIECNPVTNAPCDADAGDGCDTDFAGGYKCLPQSTVSLCGDCNEVDGPYCIGTATCLPLSDAGTQKCFRYCCTDSDCAPGVCNKTAFGIAPLGACTQ